MRIVLAPAVPLLAIAASVMAGACQVPQSGVGKGGLSRDGGSDAAFGDGACARIKCPPLECGAGMIALPLSGECCSSVCVPDDCSTVDCAPAPVCAPGMHSDTPAGACCPRCVPNATGSGTCADGQTGYAEFLARELASAAASSCNADGDCRLIALDNACGASCGTPVSVRGAASVVSAANLYASANCAACPAATPCPPVERFAVCSGGVCTSY